MLRKAVEETDSEAYAAGGTEQVERISRHVVRGSYIRTYFAPVTMIIGRVGSFGGDMGESRWAFVLPVAMIESYDCPHSALNCISSVTNEI